MTQTEVLRLALEALELVSIEFVCNGAHHAKKDRHEWLDPCPIVDRYQEAITAIKAALEAKDEPWEQFYPEMGKPYAFEASMYPRVIIDPVTGNVSIGTVTKPCGLECDCTDVCKQDDYKALWQQMCERCDELDKKLAHLETKDEPVAWRYKLQGQWIYSDVNPKSWNDPWPYNEQPLYTNLLAQEAKDEPVAWMVTTEMQDGTHQTYPLLGTYKDACDVCDFGKPLPLYTMEKL